MLSLEKSRITPSQLPAVAVTLQALDNQWVPNGLLETMLKQGLSLAAVKRQRNAYVRTEFIRSLINAETTIAAHNSYINDEVIGDFLHPEHPEHRSFCRLLSEGALVPYLYKSASPLIHVDELHFSHNTKQLHQWNQLCQQVDVPCLRLDWDDELNAKAIRSCLDEQFSKRLQALAVCDTETFIEAFTLDRTAIKPLRNYLIDVATTSLQHYGETGRHISRDSLYRHYITQPDSQVFEGQYDGAKPFAGVFKQMVDLIYATNLSDAISRYPLTPTDSPPRSVLQEMSSLRWERPGTCDDFLRLIKNIQFDHIQRDLSFAFYGLLTLDDVVALRNDEGTDHIVWRSYIDSVRRVFELPDGFEHPDAIASIYKKYIDLADQAGKLAIRNRRTAAENHVQPGVKLLIEIGGINALEVLWHPHNPLDKILIHTLAKETMSRLKNVLAPAIARLVIAGRDALLGDPVADSLGASIVFWQGRMQNAGEQIDALTRKLSEGQQFQLIEGENGLTGSTSTLDAQG